jgi:hypothetical protein
MNSQALSHIFQSSKQMLEQSFRTIVELKEQLEGFMLSYDVSALRLSGSSEPGDGDTEEERKRRRKLKTIRWTMALALTIAGYKLVRYAAQWRRRKSHPQYHQIEAASSPWTSSAQPQHYHSDPYSNHGHGTPFTNQHLGYSNPSGVGRTSRHPPGYSYPQPY